MPLVERFHLHFDRFVMDVARWIQPEAVWDTNDVTIRHVISGLWQHPGLRAMMWFRLASLAKEMGIRGLPTLIRSRLLSRFGLELLPGADIGGGLYIAHPSGCTLVAEKIGSNVTVISTVTFGYSVGKGWPVIGDRTYFGAGCRVLGRITIGEGSRVGANAVVLHDVGPGETVVGVPARPIHGRRSALAPGSERSS